MTFPTALAAPVEEGIMLAEAPRPPRPIVETLKINDLRNLGPYKETILTVLVGGSVDGLLGGSGGVDGGHQTFNNTKLVVDNLGQRSQTVGGTRGVGDDLVLGLVGVQVDSDDEHRGVGRRSRDDDLLGTSLQVGGSLVDGGEDTSGLDNVVGTRGSPLNVGGVTLTVNVNGGSVDDELAILVGNLSLESTVGLYKDSW